MPDVAIARAAWSDAQGELDVGRLFFIDDTGTSMKMARMFGSAPRGARCRALIPHGHCPTTTFVGALTPSGILAPLTLGCPINGPAFWRT